MQSCFLNVAEVRISHFHSAENRYQNDPTRVFLSHEYSTCAMGVRKVTEIDRACYINFDDERFWKKNHTPTTYLIEKNSFQYQTLNERHIF